jgi:hypothetical protein
MKPIIYFFLKFCQEEEHARAFVAGRLHLNPLAYFKGLEQGADDGRADRHEVPLAWYQPAKLGFIQFGPHRIDATELAGPLIMPNADADTMNILCLYAATSGPFETLSAASLDAVREHLLVPDRCRSMGPFVVLVHDSRAFIKRFEAAVKRDHFGLQRGLVTYFDPDSFSGSVEHPAFMKKQEFAWQREYRFALDRNATEAKPYTLDLGPLDDICKILDAATLNEPFTVALPE